jgi:hypothetical protein
VHVHGGGQAELLTARQGAAIFLQRSVDKSKQGNITSWHVDSETIIMP